MKKSFFSVMLFMAISYLSAVAQKPAIQASDKAGWHRIATEHVDYKTEMDEISVMGKDHFSQIKLRAKDANVDLKSFNIYYEKDSVQVVPLTKIINAGEETVPTVLTHKNMEIKRIVLVYKTAPTRHPEGKGKEKAAVEIWGLK